MSFSSPRPSPFKRPDLSRAASPSAVRGATTPSTSPTKPSTSATHMSPTKPSSPSLSPEKHNPFVRRPSQLGPPTSPRATSPFARPTSPFARPSSPFTRPSSRLSVAESPSRALSFTQDRSVSPAERPPQSPSVERSVSPAVEDAPAPAVPSSPAASKAPVLGTPIMLDGGSPSSPGLAPSPSPSPSPSPVRPAAMARPVAQRTVTSSTAATIRPFNFSKPTPSSPSPATQRPRAPLGASGPNYNHIPQPMLRSMRESFEVLDSANSGTVDSASLAAMLDQVGMDSSPRALSAFFPPNGPATLNLARYLDIVSSAHSHLSPPDELAAAFAAFDVDDSGQIDLQELRDALLHTTAEPGTEPVRLTEADVDTIMADFSGRRAFGGKGVFKNGTGGPGRRDVFRYRDFIANISGGAEVPADQVEVA